MKFKTALVAALSVGFALAARAETYTFVTDAYANSTTRSDGLAATGSTDGLVLTTGETFTVSTAASQYWSGAAVGDGNYATLHTNANGTTSNSWNVYLDGAGYVHAGTLVADIDGIYEVLGAGTATFTAWASGEISLFYVDVNNYDNSGSITTTISVVPEPASLALMAAGLGLVGLSRRRKSAQS